MADLDVTATVEQRGVDIDLQVPDGQTIALLGANGAGKSTLLSVIAGLLIPDRGQVVLGGRVLTGAGRRRVPTHKRHISLLAQEAALFPHLSVRTNIGFGPRSRRLADASQRTEHWLAAVNAVELADRRPGQLSGGQQQRVALARALAADPELLLLDEPLAALDVSVAEDLRHLLARHLRDTTTIIVTHDLVDVLSLADRVVTLDAGKIVEDGPVADVLAAPRSEFTARLAGLDLLPGTIAARADGTVTVSVTGSAVGTGHQVVTGSTTTAWQVTGADHLAEAEVGDPVVAITAPTAVVVHRRTDNAPPTGSQRNALPACVVDLQATPAGIRVRAVPAGADRPTVAADITAAAARELVLAPGDEIWLTVKAQEVAVHPARR